jgi:hypothetical protein
MSRSYTPLPPSASMACRGTALLYFLSVFINDENKVEEKISKRVSGNLALLFPCTVV